MHSRFVSAIAVCAAFVCGCTAIAPGTPASPTATVDSAIARGRQYLQLAQARDGAWRSDKYSSFRDGPSLTPLVLLALEAGRTSPETNTSFTRGTDYLVGLVRRDGSIDEGQFGRSYPVYSAALATRVLSLPGMEHHRIARDAWLADLRRRQLDESLGWSPDDAAYGGWGYCHAIPKKPKPGEFVPQLLESNLSATVFALDALRGAQVPTEDPAFRKALIFIRRCQNFADDPVRADPAFDDGGFHFIYDDPARNKPGPAGRDRHGRPRFRSYGSTTADGFRALLRCGAANDDPRALAALAWLKSHFKGAGHVGDYPPERSSDRSALDYYFAWSLAQLFEEVPFELARAWAVTVSSGLCERQQPDGCWTNPSKAVREDDPLLATALAVAALQRCRDVLARK
jgi:squalene-hopene/tetraprenyl-beta-curcumene cyclase